MTCVYRSTAHVNSECEFTPIPTHLLTASVSLHQYHVNIFQIGASNSHSHWRKIILRGTAKSKRNGEYYRICNFCKCKIPSSFPAGFHSLCINIFCHRNNKHFDVKICTRWSSIDCTLCSMHIVFSFSISESDLFAAFIYRFSSFFAEILKVNKFWFSSTTEAN